MNTIKRKKKKENKAEKKKQKKTMPWSNCMGAGTVEAIEIRVNYHLAV